MGKDKSHYHCWEQKQPPACGLRVEHIRCCLCGHTKSVEGESWEKEFNRVFSPGKIGWSTPLTLQQDLKSFITDLLAKEREKLVTAVEGLMTAENRNISDEEIAENAALEHAANLIRNTNNHD